ncbi:MAG: antibiotic biosynthesis monooxygenase [Muribaculaceae bacterium]
MHDKPRRYDKMKTRILPFIIAMFMMMNLHAQGKSPKLPMTDDGIVRYSVIEVAPEYLDDYLPLALEVGEVSMKTEPGVLAMYPTAAKGNPCLITIMEIYSSQEAYRQHINSPHFQKYKQGTLHMIKSLQLLDQIPLNPSMSINAEIK